MRGPITKDFTLGEHTYRIRKMDARTGSWLASQITSYLLPSAIESGLAREGLDLPASNKRSEHMSEADFRNLQNHCLLVCGRLSSAAGVEVVTPVLHGSGRWSFEDLETDAVTVLVLTVHALLFSVGTFFDKAVLDLLSTAVMEYLPDLSQLVAEI
jgi:hypothetical protein